MKIEEVSSGVIIDFGNTQRARVKIFFIIQALVGLGTVFIWLMLTAGNASAAAWGFIFAFSVVYILYSYRFLIKASSRERLILTPAQVFIENINIFGVNRKAYEVSRISHWRYTGATESVRHTLATQSFDYLGFDTNRKVIDKVHDDGNFSFDYDGKIVHFGRNIYSWQAAEVDKWVKQIIKDDLSVADADEQFLKSLGYSSNNMLP